MVAIRGHKASRPSRLVSVVAAGWLACSVSASAQTYPSATIHIVSSTFPGAIVDLLARTFAQKLQERSSQAVVVENTQGATGTLGVSQAAKEKPDGYNLLIAHVANMSILPILNPKLPYDPQTQFVPVALLGTATNMLMVPASSPIRSVKELIDEAKAKPGTLTYASQGLGSTAHIAMAHFNLAAGIDMIHVPYRGGGPALNALVGGQVSLMMYTVPGAMAQVQGGTLRALAVASKERAAVLPDVPTMTEVGMPEVEGGLWVGLFAPANTPPAIVAYLNKQAQDIFALPDVRDKLEQQGVVLPKASPEQFAKFLGDEDRRWRDVIARAKITFPQ
jgi:tripartite-type tricarboxylate transporter receptor subunit TctC